MTSTLDHSRKSPLLLCGNHITNTLYEYTAWLDILGNGISTLLENSMWCIKCTFTMQWQQYLLPVSCFHFSVRLLHAWLFWEMTSLLCWKFTLVYKVHIHYAMATILVACVLQSHQNTTLYYEYRIAIQSSNTGLQYRKHISPTSLHKLSAWWNFVGSTNIERLGLCEGRKKCRTG